MATEYVTGTEYNDWLDGGDGDNTYEGGAGDDWINGASGDNTIVFNIGYIDPVTGAFVADEGDGIDTISYAPPRTYQFAGWLEEIERALASDDFSSATYGNTYFAGLNSSLLQRLPDDPNSTTDMKDVLQALSTPVWTESGDLLPGTVDGDVARAAFEQLRDWINTPVTNLVKFGAGISLTDLSVQVSAISSFNAPAIFSIAVGGDQGMVFSMVPPDLAAASSMPTEPPPMDIRFEFADGTTATLAEVLALADGGVAGFNNGTDESEVLSGSLADDQIYGNGGDDQIDGRAGMDFIYGGAGNDVIDGGAGPDIISGDDGDDVMAAGADGSSVGGGAGNDVYLFNMGDGALFIDNTPGTVSGETDTLSFGKDIAPGEVIAYVDEFGTLTLAVQGTSDQVLINWFMNNYDGTYSLREDQVVPRVQFIDASGSVRVYDLATLVNTQQAQLLTATVDDPVYLFAGASEMAGVPVAGGDFATRYATTGSLFEVEPPPGNQAPVAGATIQDATAVEDQPLQVALPAGAFADADGDNLVYSASLEGGAGLPTWLQFNSQTLTFTGTPDDAQVNAGDLRISVTASDGQASATQTFTLALVGVNDAPQAAAPSVSATATEDSAFSFALPAGFFSDADLNDGLTVNADAADMPAWLTFDAASMTFSGTPTNDDVGSVSITVTATDGEASTFTEVTIAVANTNDAPTVQNELGNWMIDEDAPFSMTIPANVFADVDAGDLLSLDLAGVPAWLTYDAATGMLSGTPGNADVGSYTLTLMASDGEASAEESFTITVVNVNDAPTLDNAIGDQALTEDQAFSFTVPAGTFSDVDSAALELWATLADGSALPAWLSFDAVNGVVSGTPTNGDVGGLQVRISASDGEYSASTVFSLNVANANDDPTREAEMADQLANEGSAFSFSLPAGMFADVDSGDVLTLSATMADGAQLPSWLSFDAANGSFSGTPGWDDAGTLSITVTATDAAGRSASDTFDLNVADVNTAPVVGTAPSDQVAVEGSAFNFALPDDTFVDPQGDSLALTATLADGSPLPAWLSFASPFNGTPDDGDVGTISIIVTATDSGGLSVSTSFELSVTNVNDLPTGGVTVSGVATENQTLTAETGAIADADGLGAFSYQWLRNGVAILDANASTYTLGQADVGSHISVQVSYTDGHGAPESLTSTPTGAVLDADPVPDPEPAPEPGRTLRGGGGSDRLVGGNGDDVLKGKGGRDVLDGGAGDDTLYFYRDSTWGRNAWRTHNGSPGVDGTGARVSIAGKRLSNDVFRGGLGDDLLLGTGGSDAILLDDTASGALESGPRLSSIETIDAGGGDDVVDLTSRRYDYGDVTVMGGAGNDTLWSSSGNDTLLGEWGNDNMHGGAGNDYLYGGSGRDVLRGGWGVDLLQGGSNDDELRDYGRSLLDGGSGSDLLVGGAGNSMFVGGRGDDTIRLGGGADVIAFNRGDGRDVVESAEGSATLSLGAGIRVRDLAFRRSGQDLVLETGNNDSITFEDWYRGRHYQAVSTLQLITGDGVQTFDFAGLVDAFNDARSDNRRLSRWALTNGLADFELGFSDEAAIGGDLAYQYGVTGSLAGIAVSAAQEVVGSSDFGSRTQQLQPLDVLQDGLVKLA
jgi:Ca2+-binding RTX toxin-like protein